LRRLCVNSPAQTSYQVAENFIDERLISPLTHLFGLLALILASIGLYGITA